MKMQIQGLLISGLLALTITTLAEAHGPDTLWTKQYFDFFDSRSYSVQETTDGGYILLGASAGGAEPGCQDHCTAVYLIRTDSMGDTLWTRTFSDTCNLYGRAVVQAADGGFLFVGSVSGANDCDDGALIVKTNPSGDVSWVKTYSGGLYTRAYAVDRTSDGGYILSGSTHPPGLDNLPYIIRLDENGDSLWTKTYGTYRTGAAYSVQQTVPDGGYVITGDIQISEASDYEAFIAKTDADGDSLWLKVFGEGQGNCVQQTSDGGYIVTGDAFSAPSADTEVYLIRTDANGDSLWARKYGGTSGEDGYSVRETAEGGFIIVGETSSFGAGYSDIFLVRTDPDGNSMWTRTYGDSSWDEGRSILIASDNSYVIAGSISFWDVPVVTLLKTHYDCSGIPVSDEILQSRLISTFPNPSSALSRVSFTLESGGFATATVYDPLGRMVRRITSASLSAGSNTVTWDGTDSDGSPAPPGVYLVRVRVGDRVATQKIVRVR